MSKSGYNQDLGDKSIVNNGGNASFGYLTAANFYGPLGNVSGNQNYPCYCTVLGASSGTITGNLAVNGTLSAGTISVGVLSTNFIGPIGPTISGGYTASSNYGNFTTVYATGNDATSTTNTPGSVAMAVTGGISVSGTVYSAYVTAATQLNSIGPCIISSSTAATSNAGSNGALQVAGGASIAGTSYIGVLNVGATLSAAVPTTKGVSLTVPPQTFTDNVTAASGTCTAIFSSAYFDQATLTATNSSVTTSGGATVHITGPPIAGTNETFAKFSSDAAGNNYLNMGTSWVPSNNDMSLLVEKGISYFGKYASNTAVTISTYGYVTLGYNSGVSNNGAPQLTFMGSSGYPIAAFYVDSSNTFQFTNYNDGAAKLAFNTQGGTIQLGPNGNGATACGHPFYPKSANSNAIQNPAGTAGTMSALWQGIGLPNDTYGKKYDFYLRGDGTTGSYLYCKNASSGASWAAIL